MVGHSPTLDRLDGVDRARSSCSGQLTVDMALGDCLPHSGEGFTAARRTAMWGCLCTRGVPSYDAFDPGLEGGFRSGAEPAHSTVR